MVTAAVAACHILATAVEAHAGRPHVSESVPEKDTYVQRGHTQAYSHSMYEPLQHNSSTRL